jgi:hypothetical protein
LGEHSLPDAVSQQPFFVGLAVGAYIVTILMLQIVGKMVGAFDRKHSVSFIAPGYPVLVVLLREINGQKSIGFLRTMKK